MVNLPPPASGPANPLVSVVLPVFNGAGYLRESLDSLLRQTYQPLEIIVLDDASTDGTPGIAASYGSRIRSIRQPVNLGTFQNANRGIDLALGEFIAIYHADDVYDSRIVEREVEFLQRHPEAGAVFCLDVFVDEQNREYGRLELPRELRGCRLLGHAAVVNGLLRHKNHFLMCPGAMVRASVYREVGGYDPARFGIAADLEMWLRIAQRYQLGMLEEYLFRYRHFHGNWSQRYHHLRTTAEAYFAVMDHCLANGGRAIATPRALQSYEYHRAEDQLRIAVSQYINRDRPAARGTLGQIRGGAIWRTLSVPRGRLLALLYTFRVLSRMPRLAPVADLFRRRWFEKRPPRTAA